MKTLKKISLLLILLLFCFRPPVSFAQGVNNDWKVSIAYFYSRPDNIKIGTILTTNSRLFSVFGWTDKSNNIWLGQSNFFAITQKSSTPDQITIDTQLKESISAISVVTTITLHDTETGATTIMGDQVQNIPLDGSWRVLKWDLKDLATRAYNYIEISIAVWAKDSCYVGAKIAMKNMRAIINGVEKIIDFDFSQVGVEKDNTIPKNFILEQNYPNPFNPATKISFSVPEAGNYKLTVYNTLSQEVATLVDGQLSAGNHEASFNAANLPSGVYVYRLTGKNVFLSRKMTLLK